MEEKAERGSSWSFWVLAIFLPAILILNIDLVIFFSTKYNFLVGKDLFFFASTLGTLELIYWYFFYKKLVGFLSSRKSIKEDKNFLEMIWMNLKMDGYADMVMNYFSNKYNSFMNKDNWLVKGLKGGSYIIIFIAGAEPAPAGRLIGVAFCGTTGWKKGLYILIVGNILKIAYTVLGWKFIFSFFN